MQFEVRALNAQQELLTLELEALDPIAAEQMLRQGGLSPVSIRATSGDGAKRTGRFPLQLFAQELRALLIAGLSVIEALDVLLDKNPAPTQHQVLSRLSGSLREGRRFSEALAEQGDVFPALFIGILRAAESSSDLPQALSRYLDYEGRLSGVRQKIVSAAIYPAILMVVGGGVAIFLMTYVVPRFASLYQSSGHALPWASRMLLSWGSFASAHATFLLVAGALFVTLFVVWVRGHLRHGTWLRALAVIPGAGSKLQVLEITRLYLTLGILLQGGMPITSAMHLASDVLPADRRAALRRAGELIVEGVVLSEAFAATGLSIPVAHRLLKVGERSGQLGEMLIRGAEFYEGETARWIERFTKAFEPVLMAAIGVVVGLIVVLLYMPIFDLAGALQ